MKRILIIISILIFIPGEIFATDTTLVNDQLEALDLSTFVNEGEKYTKEIFPDLDIQKLIIKNISGKIENPFSNKTILKILGVEIANGFSTIACILIIVIVHSILKSIAENLDNGGVSRIAYFVEYILIVTILINSFTETLTRIQDTIANLVGFMNTLIPILVSLIVATGQVASSTIIQPILIFAIIFIGNGINLFVIPIIMASIVLTVASNISDKIQITNLAKLFKSSAVWILGFVITIFVGVLSIEGTLTSSVDGITIKGLKTVTSTFIPVVGKALGDSVDTVLGATSLIKNSIGFIGIIIIIGICILPIIKLTILTVMYNLTGAICEPLADKKIVNVINQIADIFKLLLGIMFFIAVLLIIGVALILKISNASLMYR